MSLINQFIRFVFGELRVLTRRSLDGVGQQQKYAVLGSNSGSKRMQQADLYMFVISADRILVNFAYA